MNGSNLFVFAQLRWENRYTLFPELLLSLA